MKQTVRDRTSTGLQMDSIIELSEIEIDALGESVNISMGAAAKVLSTILNLKVSITAPHVSMKPSNEYEYQNMAPAVGVKIEYVEGLTGVNFFVLRQQDVKLIANIMMGIDNENDVSPITDLHTSAISEVMNQMMGASSTSLAIFYDRKIGISTPDCILIEENITAGGALDYEGDIVIIRFNLKIGDIIDSELINIMPIEFAKDLAVNLINVKLPSHSKSIAQRGADDEEAKQKRQYESPELISFEQGEVKMPNEYQPAKFSALNTAAIDNKPALSNLNIIMDVPLEVIVQIGKTKKQIMEILEFTQGSIIELDKQAGDPVDIIVNGELIARGDVVVIDDNFGVRITQIVHG